VKHEVCSRDEVMHVGVGGLWFSTRSWLEGEQARVTTTFPPLNSL